MTFQALRSAATTYGIGNRKGSMERPPLKKSKQILGCHKTLCYLLLPSFLLKIKEQYLPLCTLLTPRPRLKFHFLPKKSILFVRYQLKSQSFYVKYNKYLQEHYCILLYNLLLPLEVFLVCQF